MSYLSALYNSKYSIEYLILFKRTVNRMETTNEAHMSFYALLLFIELNDVTQLQIKKDRPSIANS
jgi:hypothetical protein